jgi:class 3 adenylate cyclase/tetratricopeptide (TPR) repeat protein
MIPCPSCGFEAPDDFAFCPKCATALAAPLAMPEERKVVTTLFCDLVAFTAMSEAADPEDVDAVLRQYHAAARKVIESHGGTVEKFIGDAVVGVFGVPTVHEDDPERAVRAGLRIVGALEGVARPDGSPLQVRVGVNTGEALVRLDVTPDSGEGFLAGDAVNTAARLQAAAPPGGVAVGALTHALTAGAIEYWETAPVVAKGKSDPVDAWLAVATVARTGLRTGILTSAPFLGRGHELAALHHALQQASREDQAQVVLLVGEPGIGKSRLVLELGRSLDELPEMITWRQGRCLPYGEGVTFAALVDIVKEHAGILDSDDVGIVESKLEAILPDGEDRVWIRRRMHALFGLEAAQASLEENFAAWQRFLEFIAESGPMVLVIEDLHWASEAMLAFVEHLLFGDLRVPLLIVATTRPELLQRHEGALTAVQSDRLRRLTLPMLSHPETGAFIAALLGTDAPGDVAGSIVERAGGNPLFAEQYVRLLLDRGLLMRAAGVPHHAADTDLPPPTTVQAVLAARLDTLPPELKALLCDAAVVGETFWSGGVAALSGRNEDDVRDALAALIARDLVRPVVSQSIKGEPEYLFWHGLTRDVAYGQLPRRLRARKHRAAALWIEGQVGVRQDEFAEILAHHYVTALDLASASGDTHLACSLVEPTIRCLAAAGEIALRLDAAAAERHFARALELADAGTTEHDRLLARWAETLFLRGRPREAAAAYEAAIETLRDHGENGAAAVAMCRLSSVLSALGEPGALDMSRAAVGLLADEGPSPEQAFVFSSYARFLQIYRGDSREVIAAATRAIEISDQLSLPTPAEAMSWRGEARLDLGDLDGLEDCERGLAAAKSQGLGAERARIEESYGLILLETRGTRVALEVLGEGLEFARSRGLEAFALEYRQQLIDCLRHAGAWDQALLDASALVPILEKAENMWLLVVVRALQALVLARRGDLAEAEPLVGWLEAIARDSQSPQSAAFALLAASAIRSRQGEQQATRHLITELAASRALISMVEDAPEAMRTALAARDEELARRLSDRFESCLPTSRLPFHHHAMTSVAGLLAEARSEHESAAARFAEASVGWRDLGVPYEEAQALLGWGRCLLALGRPPAAVPPLSAAREIFARLKAKPALADTDDCLAGVATT